MKLSGYIILSLFFLILTGCITEFVPQTNETQESLVVEGLITDQNISNTVRLSKSVPLGEKNTINPLSGCNVYITDDLGNRYFLKETVNGTYKTDSTHFTGQVGRKYVLNIVTNGYTETLYTYKSLPMEMKSVPAIDSLYYEKETMVYKEGTNVPLEQGCQIYLNTYDPTGTCEYYRWSYSETWEFRLPYAVPNSKCWFSNNSGTINIKSTSVLSENRINRFPLNFISNGTDRLKYKYSALVYQYSLTEDEFAYWEKLKNVSQNVGGLYDVTPATIPGNVFCCEDPAQTVLGYFSVSARSSKRIVIDDNFFGIINLYSDCVSDTVYGNKPVPGLGTSVWILRDEPYENPPFKVLTEKKFCYDCTTRGTTTKPDFWDDIK